MFSIRQNQLYEMGELLFVQRFRAVLVDSFKETRSLPADKLDAEILVQVRKAESYGIRVEQAVASFVTTAWLLGPNFDVLIPGVRARLMDPGVSEFEKASWLELFAVRFLNSLEQT